MPKLIYQAETGKMRSAAEPLPEGEYLARVTKCEETVSKNSGAPMFKLECVIDGAPWPIDEYLVFSQGGMMKINCAVKSCGVDKKLGASDGAEIELDAQHFVGATGKVKLVIEEYNGKRRNKIDWWVADWRNEDGSPKPANDEPDDDVPW
jgi:hypothetical protein